MENAIFAVEYPWFILTFSEISELK